MNFRPLHNAVVVEPLPEPERARPGSLIVAPPTSLHSGEFEETGGTVGSYTDRGRVVAVGDGYKYGKRFIPESSGSKQGKWEELVLTKRIPLAVKVGNLVLYAHKGGQDYTEGGVRYRIIPESQIEAVLLRRWRVLLLCGGCCTHEAIHLSESAPRPGEECYCVINDEFGTVVTVLGEVAA